MDGRISEVAAVLVLLHAAAGDQHKQRLGPEHGGHGLHLAPGSRPLRPRGHQHEAFVVRQRQPRPRLVTSQAQPQGRDGIGNPACLIVYLSTTINSKEKVFFSTYQIVFPTTTNVHFSANISCPKKDPRFSNRDGELVDSGLSEFTRIKTFIKNINFGFILKQVLSSEKVKMN